MKKLILIIAISMTVSVSVFAQGTFILQTAARYLYDDWSAVAPKADASNDFALYIGTGTPLIDTLGGGGVATNATSLPNGLTTSAAWTAILSDPNFVLATNNGTSSGVIGGPTSAVGGISYLSGATFTVSGTAAAGGTATLYMIGWNDAYATPALAAAAGAAVGWSTAFNYAYAAGPVPGPAGTPGNETGLLTPFGVANGVAVPEPSTMALAGLGGLAALLFRRKK
jgi:hypothetical protein